MTEAWVAGGRVPIFPASTYLGSTRAGTQTIDENLVHTAQVDLLALHAEGVDFSGSTNITAIGNVVNGRRMGSVIFGDFYTRDVLVLCFSNSLSAPVAARLGKSACVEILDVRALKFSIDRQLGVRGKAGYCRYRSDHIRDHFTKSTSDQWQDEYRLVWPVLKPEKAEIDIPAGTARHVTLAT